MYAITKNPPLTGYVIALVTALAGWGEPALHLAFLVPAAVVVVCTYRLAERFGAEPRLATLSGLFSPVFLVSSTNVMSDTLQLAFWCAALYAWVLGFDRERAGPRWTAGVLAGLGIVTKYFAIALVPLLLAYGLARTRRLGAWALPLLVPLGMALAYELVTWRLYPELEAPLGLLSDAVLFSSSFRDDAGLGLLTRGWIGLMFAGGCVVSALFFSPLLWPRSVLALALAGGAGLVVWMSSSGVLWDATFLEIPSGWTPPWALASQGTLFALGGLAILALAASDLARERSPEAWLLFLWVVGTFAFAAFVNWINNGRSNLPLAPAVGILIARRLARREEPLATPALLAAGLPAALVALAVAWADAAFANATRDAVARIESEHMQPPGRATIFQGHWGFQWYMEEAGAQAWEYGPAVPAGVVCVLPQNNVNVWLSSLSPTVFRPLEDLQPPARYVHTMSNHVRAGFYASNQGRMPYAFGVGRQDRFLVLESKIAFEPFQPQEGVVRLRPPRR